MSVVGIDTSFEEEQLNTGDEKFMITALENRDIFLQFFHVLSSSFLV
jgi:hypothetical protein